ncbi:MAG: hypothetical protein IKY87_02275 [Paludibacteraceae bacterium]|nr:hypothetical protein [Paludibacteraceae bacterium]
MPTQFSPEIVQLRNDIEKRIGQALHSPADFQLLIKHIWLKQHTIMSLSTIKRLWGYVESNGAPRISTLNTLARFLDHADWHTYLVALEQQGGIESALCTSEGIQTADLHVGERIAVAWQPNRQCVFRYLGNNQFIVEDSKNAKLQQGTTFSAARFMIDQPMYLDNILLADGTRTSYVAGKRNGLTSVTKL